MSNSHSPQLVMRRPSLDGLPPLSLAEGYELRHFTDNDEEGWNRLMDVVFERPQGTTDFSASMRASQLFQHDRVFVIVADGEVIATASGWHHPKFGARSGYLHWVAAHPDHRGKKLGRSVSVAAMHRMVQDGRNFVALETDDFRLPAVKIYLDLGFHPLLIHESQREHWPVVLETLEYPERFEAALSEPLFEPLPGSV